jgi:hypothetical protein
MSNTNESPGGGQAKDRRTAWKPGDPDRRQSARSLLEATNTTREEHLPPERRRANRRKPA